MCVCVCETIDVEDQAAKISVEEQMLITAIETLRKDLESGFSVYLLFIR